jgi:hypothetical protein
MRHFLLSRRIRGPAGVLVCAALAVAFTVRDAGAGWIRGTVRDGLTAAPVAGAGVFVRLVSGVYTGVHSASDAGGAFCVGDLAPGVYDLEIRHVDYATRYLRGVQLTGSTTGVDAALPPGAGLLPPAPNPARTRVAFELRGPAGSPARLTVLDLQGRSVRTWEGEARGAMRVEWDLRDASGARVPPGLYLIRLDTGGTRSTRRFLVIP